MRLSSIMLTTAIFVGAALISYLVAMGSVRVIERVSKADVLNALDKQGLVWAEVDTRGLQVLLIGTAPDEAARFRALATAGGVVDAARVIDFMLVEDPDAIDPPRFSIEILRNDAGISVIGLIPNSTDRDALISQIRNIAGEAEVSDLLASSAFAAPEGWERALTYSIRALRDLPRSKISLDAQNITIKAMLESEQVRVRLQSTLMRRKPDDLQVTLDLSAPRPVISPFMMRFVMDEEGARFDACSSASDAGRSLILEAAIKAGMTETGTCALGLGSPSRHWADAVAMAIGKLHALGGGALTFANGDVTLVAHMGTDEALFDRVIGEMEADLPPGFILVASLPQPPENSDQGPPEFVATLSPEGKLQLRGRLSSEMARTTIDSFARAHFGSASVYTAARVVEGLPGDWPLRTLSALQALSELSQGAATVTPDAITLTGRTGNTEASARIAALLASKLGEAAQFELDITYDERLDPALAIPTPEQCETMIRQVIGARKITFKPSSATLDASAEGIMDELAELLKTCGDIPIEVGGHTDSQGREIMNERLSRERAQAVLDALHSRRVPVRAYSVKGYGESQPIANNGTEEGREANRRIEFKLLQPEGQDPALEQADDEVSPPGTGDGTAAAPEETE